MGECDPLKIGLRTSSERSVRSPYRSTQNQAATHKMGIHVHERMVGIEELGFGTSWGAAGLVAYLT